MAEALLISTKDIIQFTSVNGNVDSDKFIQYVKIAQDTHIQNYLGTNVDKNEIDFLIEKERGIAQHYTNLFIDYMSFNASSLFPEYYSNINDDIYPDKDSNFSGWVL